MNILPMELRHTAQIAALEKKCFSDPWNEASVSSELENPLSLWLVAEEDGAVVGYVGSQTCADETDMMNLAVAPEYRRKGVGRALVLALCTELRKIGSTALTLEVRVSNENAVRLYASLGFTQVGRRPNYYFHPKEDARILRKELN